MEQQVRKDVTWRKGRCGSSGKMEIMEKLDVRCTTCCSCGWGETMSTELSHHWAYCLSPQVIYEYGYSPDYIWIWRVTMEQYGQENEERRERPVSVPLCPPQTPTWTDLGKNPGICSERLATNWALILPDVPLQEVTSLGRRRRKHFSGNFSTKFHLDPLSDLINKRRRWLDGWTDTT
jgi:hypothetical protein